MGSILQGNGITQYNMHMHVSSTTFLKPVHCTANKIWVLSYKEMGSHSEQYYILEANIYTAEPIKYGFSLTGQGRNYVEAEEAVASSLFRPL